MRCWFYWSLNGFDGPLLRSRSCDPWHFHPGTVDTPLSSAFGKTSLNVQSPDVAAIRLLAVIAGLGRMILAAFSTIAGSVCHGELRAGATAPESKFFAVIGQEYFSPNGWAG